MSKIRLTFSFVLISVFHLPALGQEAAFGCRTEPFPLTEASRPPSDGAIESKPCFGDLDSDGDQDLLIGTFEGSIDFYRNIGSAAEPLFILEAEHLHSIDVGLHCSPALADLDNDGDLDLLVGESEGNINFFRNTGTAQEPQFELEAEYFAGIKVGLRSTPTIADLDGDKALDLTAGDFWGYLKFYRNTGSGSTASFELDPQVFDSIKVEFHSAPAFADYDNDGDLDLFVGERGGKVRIYRNIGSPRAPRFLPQGILLAAVDAQVDSHPAFADIDGDQDPDLFVGKSDGRLLFCRNLSKPSSAKQAQIHTRPGTRHMQLRSSNPPR